VEYKVKLASKNSTDQVLSLFEKYLLPNNDALSSEEFLCPFGVRAAIRRNQMLVIYSGSTIIAAARFYKKKHDKETSLYQFVVDVNHRGKRLLLKMLNFIRDQDIVSLCPKNSDFNNYYRKTGWILSKKNGEKYNHWVLPAKQKI